MTMTQSGNDSSHSEVIIIYNDSGKPNLLSLKDSAKQSLRECERIVKTAAKHIKSKINTYVSSMNEYPTKEKIEDHSHSLIPDFRLFMK